jgi:CBS domain-containing protein
MTSQENAPLELDDIQSGVLPPRPTPYAATYIALRIDTPDAGRELMRRVSTVVTSATNPTSPLADTWASVALTYSGLIALGVPHASLESFAWEFKQGMAARANELGDTGESSPENWERPLGTGDIHLVLVVVSPNQQQLEAAVDPARKAYGDMRGIEAIWRQDCHALPTETEPFGFRDGISGSTGWQIRQRSTSKQPPTQRASRQMRVGAAMRTPDVTLEPSMNPDNAARLLKQQGREQLPVLDGNKFLGMLSKTKVEEANADIAEIRHLLGDAEFPHLHPDHTLDLALHRMGVSHVQEVPVVSRRDVHELEGSLRLQDVLRLYGFDRTKWPTD